MKKIILTLISATLLLASPAVVVEKKENPQTGKHAKITAAIDATIAQRELEREKNTLLREEKIKEIDAALKEKAKIRAEEA